MFVKTHCHYCSHRFPNRTCDALMLLSRVPEQTARNGARAMPLARTNTAIIF
jgi:hypothetical protein